jgi:PII-like signaling protein
LLVLDYQDVHDSFIGAGGPSPQLTKSLFLPDALVRKISGNHQAEARFFDATNGAGAQRGRASTERDLMLSPGLAKKVTIHLNDDTSSHRDFLSREILSLLLREGVAGATVMRPEAGFGTHHRVHSREGGIDTAQHMPLRIEFVEMAQKVQDLLPSLIELVNDGLIEAHDTVILKMAVGTAR